MGVETELRHDRRLSELLDEVPGSEAPQRKSYRARKKSDPRKFIGTFQTVIDGLPEQIALVDENWDILVVNEAWTTTAAQYGYGDLGPGSNYLQFCERKALEGHSAAAIAAGGAREIASGQKEAFRFIYHGRDQWEGAAFQLCIARVEAEGRRFATITRYDVSELVELRLMRTGYSDLLIEKQADERRRLARDIHDSTMQILVALGFSIGRLKRPHDPDARENIVREMEGLLDEAQRELRSIAYLAHPPLLQEIGFVEAVQALTEGYGRRTGLTVSLQIDAPPDTDWRTAETVLYRVIQEALSNSHRHASATEISVRLISRSGVLHAIVADNGVGISRRYRKGVGLPSMRARLREHGGRLTIRQGSPGTTIIASLPRYPQLRAVGDLKMPETTPSHGATMS